MIPDFSKQPKHLKSLFMNVLLIPFWYVSIYLFHPTLYNSNDLILIGAVCICLTLCSSIISSSYIHILLAPKSASVLDYEIMAPAVVAQIVFHAVLIIICYMWEVFKGEIILFYGFVLIYFGFSILFNLWFKEHIKWKEETTNNEN